MIKIAKEVTQISVDVLKVHPRNTEFFDEINGEDYEKFKNSIKNEGILSPIIVSPDMTIISGHQRAKAAKELGMDSVPIIIKEGITDEDDLLLEMLVSNLYRVKDIPNKAKRIMIVTEIARIKEKEERKIKEIREKIIKENRKEITKYKDNLLRLRGGKCEICEFDLPQLLEIHHKLPLTRGGNNSLGNLSVLCPTCHRVLHKYISYYHSGYDDSNVFLEIEEWLKRNYQWEAYERAKKLFIDYIYRNKEYAWKELTWV